MLDERLKVFKEQIRAFAAMALEAAVELCPVERTDAAELFVSEIAGDCTLESLVMRYG